MREAGLEDRVTIRVASYETLEGPFDKIASIGMFEHIGIANHDAYFSTVNRLLAPDGIYLHHAITRRMKKSKRAFARKSPEHRALVKYIFPGGELDHIGMTLEGLEAHRFEVHDVENLREHYGRTCRLWADRLARPHGRGDCRSRRSEGPALAALSHRLRAGLRARHGPDQPDGGDPAPPRAFRPSADARRPLR